MKKTMARILISWEVHYEKSNYIFNYFRYYLHL